MRVSEALELAGKSMEHFEDKMVKIKLKELYELTDNLRFANNPPVFRIAYNVLKEGLVEMYEYMKSLEKKHKKEDFKDVRRPFAWERIHAFDFTRFDIFNPNSPELNLNILPSDFFKSLIDNISSWEK